MSPVVVCFIEDSDLDYEMGMMAISSENPSAQVIRAIGCPDGQKLLAENAPQLIFLDLNLARCNGLELLRHISERYPDRLKSVVVFTTSSNPQDRAMALNLGAADFQVKSTDPNTYLKTVQSIASRLLN